MRTKMFKITIIVLILTAAVQSCEKESTSLPLATQTGANTFGCYVNGELFVASSIETEYWNYNPSLGKKELCIWAWGSGKHGLINIRVKNPVLNMKLKMSSARYANKNYTYTEDDTGEIMITRLDMENRIVSGNFAFDLPYYYPIFSSKEPPKDMRVKVTVGRFDIKNLTVSNF